MYGGWRGGGDGCLVIGKDEYRRQNGDMEDCKDQNSRQGGWWLYSESQR